MSHKLWVTKNIRAKNLQFWSFFWFQRVHHVLFPRPTLLYLNSLATPVANLPTRGTTSRKFRFIQIFPWKVAARKFSLPWASSSNNNFHFKLITLWLIKYDAMGFTHNPNDSKSMSQRILAENFLTDSIRLSFNSVCDDFFSVHFWLFLRNEISIQSVIKNLEIKKMTCRKLGDKSFFQ